MLLLPRMAPQRWADWLRGDGSSSGTTSGDSNGDGSGDGGCDGSGAAAAGQQPAAVGLLLRLLAAPLLVLQAMSTMNIPWLLQARQL